LIKCLERAVAVAVLVVLGSRAYRNILSKRYMAHAVAGLYALLSIMEQFAHDKQPGNNWLLFIEYLGPFFEQMTRVGWMWEAMSSYSNTISS